MPLQWELGTLYFAVSCNAWGYMSVGAKLRNIMITHLGGYLIWNKSRCITTQSKYLTDLANTDRLGF